MNVKPVPNKSVFELAVVKQHAGEDLHPEAHLAFHKCEGNAKGNTRRIAIIRINALGFLLSCAGCGHEILLRSIEGLGETAKDGAERFLTLVRPAHYTECKVTLYSEKPS